MSLIVIVVFVGVFTVVALLVFAMGTGASQKTQQVYAALDSALGTDDAPNKRDMEVNLRKSDMISSIPWLNRKLHEYELAPLLHTLLHQADLKWNAGTLLAGCGLCFALPAYL